MRFLLSMVLVLAGCSGEPEVCDSFDCVAERLAVEKEQACRFAVEDIRGWPAKWGEGTALEGYAGKLISNGVLFRGDNVALNNDHGEWARYRYTCLVDVDSGELIKAAAWPGTW